MRGAEEAERRYTPAWYCLAAVPVAALGMMLSFAAFAWLQTGAWPTYGHPDPKDLSPLLQIMSLLALVLAFPAGLTAVVGLPITTRLRPTSRDLTVVATTLVALVVLYVLATGSLGDWLLD